MKQIQIQISGPVGTGKTLIQQHIAASLRKILKPNTKMIVDWGLDGNPFRTDEKVTEILEELEGIEVLITTQATYRASNKSR
jgi:hypothetical protein